MLPSMFKYLYFVDLKPVKLYKPARSRNLVPKQKNILFCQKRVPLETIKIRIYTCQDFFAKSISIFLQEQRKFFQ